MLVKKLRSNVVGYGDRYINLVLILCVAEKGGI